MPPILRPRYSCLSRHSAMAAEGDSFHGLCSSRADAPFRGFAVLRCTLFAETPVKGENQRLIAWVFFRGIWQVMPLILKGNYEKREIFFRSIACGLKYSCKFAEQNVAAT